MDLLGIYRHTAYVRKILRAVFAQPRRLTVGGKTRIALMPEYSPAAVDKVEYRIFAEGSAAGAWQNYESEIEVNSFAQNQSGFYIVEYRTTNMGGNTEAPQQAAHARRRARPPG
jgi:hypothetical protein